MPASRRGAPVEASAEAPPTPRRSGRACRAPTAPDKTPPPPPPKKTRRQRRQPDPPADPVPDPLPPVSTQPEVPPVDAEPAQSGGARPRDIFDDDDDDPVDGAAHHPHVRFSDDNNNDGEYVDTGTPLSTPSTSSNPSPTPSRSPSQRRRRRGSLPRAGPHARPEPSPHGPHPKKKGGKSARDVWPFFDPKDPQVSQKRECLFCRQNHRNPHEGTSRFSKTTSTGVLRNHLFEHHLDAWVTACDQLQIPITAPKVVGRVEEHRARKRQTTTGANSTSESEKGRPQYSQEAFVDALVEWIVSDDQSINVVENEHLRKIFLMLRSELNDSDIPHRTKIRKRVIEVWDEHLSRLQSEMATAIGMISTTMDLWSDKQKTPFMAVTAHWLQAKLIDTPAGPQYELTLRTDLIGFLRVPGHHDGEHLATAFVHILDRIDITHKLGWITLDNASNNDTFMTALERFLDRRKIPFNKLERRIRCFPHIVNLACKAVLSAITDMDFAAQGAADFVPGSSAQPQTVMDAIDRDPVATVRTTVRIIRASSLRRQYFSEVLQALQKKDLQLLRDVDTRWSSTLIMIDRALLLREAIDQFLSDPQFQDLQKYKLSAVEWEALEAFKRILAVPHAFQQKLSAEKTPTLDRALPAFEAMISKWEKQQEQYPETAHVVQHGIEKLQTYWERVEDVPAYTLSMLINPAVKLHWFEKHKPGRVQWARNLFLRELKHYRNDSSDTPARSSQSNWADEILDMDTPARPTHTRQSLRDEVDAYLREPWYFLGSLRYWTENQLRYPTIFKLAVDILPIQGSAVPCERVFSSGAETDTLRRSRMAPDLMEALQMLKFSIKQGRGLDFTAGTSREDEIAFMEALTEDRGLVPEDSTGYSTFIRDLLDTEYDSD